MENNKKSLSVVFCTFPQTTPFTGDDSPMAQLLLSVMGAFAEFERAIIKERQKEGIELAKKKGIYKRQMTLYHYLRNHP